MTSSTSTTTVDINRKRAFLNWIVEIREQTVKVLAMCRYLTTRHNPIYSAIAKYLEYQELFLFGSADSLFLMSGALRKSHQPRFNVDVALETCRYGTYQRFSRGMTVRQQAVISDDAEIDKSLEAVIASHLVTAKRPAGLKFRLKNSQLIAYEDGMYELKMSMRGIFEPEFKWSWIATGLRITLRYHDRSDECPVHPQQRDRMLTLIAKQLETAATEDVFIIVHQFLHAACVKMAFEMIHAQASRLFLADDVSRTDDKIEITYWPELPVMSMSKPLEQPNVHHMFFEIRKHGASTELSAFASDDPDEVFTFDLNGLSILSMIEQIMQSHSCKYLKNIQSILEDEMRIDSVSVEKFANEYRVCIKVSAWLTVYLKINKKNGRLMLTDYRFAEGKSMLSTVNLTQLFENAEVQVNANTEMLVAILWNISTEMLFNHMSLHLKSSGLIEVPQIFIETRPPSLREAFFKFPHISESILLAFTISDDDQMRINVLDLDIQISRSTKKYALIDETTMIICKQNDLTNLVSFALDISKELSEILKHIAGTCIRKQFKELAISFTTPGKGDKYRIRETSLPPQLRLAGLSFHIVDNSKVSATGKYLDDESFEFTHTGIDGAVSHLLADIYGTQKLDRLENRIGSVDILQDVQMRRESCDMLLVTLSNNVKITFKWRQVWRCRGKLPVSASVSPYHFLSPVISEILVRFQGQDLELLVFIQQLLVINDSLLSSKQSSKKLTVSAVTEDPKHGVRWTINYHSDYMFHLFADLDVIYFIHPVEDGSKGHLTNIKHILSGLETRLAQLIPSSTTSRILKSHNALTVSTRRPWPLPHIMRYIMRSIDATLLIAAFSDIASRHPLSGSVKAQVNASKQAISLSTAMLNAVIAFDPSILSWTCLIKNQRAGHGGHGTISKEDLDAISSLICVNLNKHTDTAETRDDGSLGVVGTKSVDILLNVLCQPAEALRHALALRQRVNNSNLHASHSQ